METLVSLCKRRGFIFQSSEIYGGTGSCWDYGPLGVELKQNIKRLWWRDYIQRRPDMVGLDASILMHAMVWKASGHVDNFTDPMVDCLDCRRRFRADKVDETPWVHYCAATKGNKFTIPPGEPCSHCGERRTLCPDCGKGSLTAPRQFNLMFKTFMGPVEEDAALTYLRPETAQGIFVNFDNVAPVHAPQAAVRHRADRQGLPQRDHAGQLHLPHARVRADGDRVLREPSRHRRGQAGRRVLARAVDRRQPRVVPALRHARGEPAAARAREGRARALRQAHGRHRVPLSHRLERARWASPTAPIST